MYSRMHVWTYWSTHVFINVWMCWCTNVLTYEWKSGWVNEWMKERTNERMNIWHRACSGPFSTVLWVSWLRGIHWWQSFFSHTLAAMARRLPLSSLVALPASRCFPATNIIAGLAASASTERTPSAWMLRTRTASPWLRSVLAFFQASATARQASPNAAS